MGRATRGEDWKRQCGKEWEEEKGVEERGGRKGRKKDVYKRPERTGRIRRGRIRKGGKKRQIILAGKKRRIRKGGEYRADK